MDLFSDLWTARSIQGLCDRLGIDSDVDKLQRQNPAYQLLETADEITLTHMAKVRADLLFEQKQRATEKDKQQPGYRAELNRQRARMGLPAL